MQTISVNRKEQWRYIFKIFPFIELPFGILTVITSNHWLVNLCMLPLFPVIATVVMHFSEKFRWQPGYLICSVNGGLFLLFIYVAGPQAPAWPMIISVCVGTSFMFNNPRVGQGAMILFAIFTAALYYYMGADIIYALTIGLSLIVFVVLFARTYDYLQIQQARIEEKNKEIELKNRDITDSISYAKKIQYAVLPHDESIYRSVPLSFILYKPKDIVSGDFFWFHEIDRDNYIIVCADCTGHGVPGAFMTVIGSNLLNQIVVDNKIYSPSKILTELDNLLNITLKQNSERFNSVQDGMDMSLLKVNKSSSELIITSAKRPAIFIRDKNLRDIKGSKFSLGGMRSGEKEFEEVKINYREDDMLYFFSDGYPDQFGGEKGKKFSSKRLKELFFKIHQKTIPEQKQILDSEIEKWRGNLEQVDDICVMGIRF